MIFNTHINGHPLIDEVHAAEHQLRLRKMALHEGIHTVDLAIRRRFTAPDAILWSVATGFVLGELTKKHGAKKTARAPVTSDGDETEPPRPGTMQLILRYWAIARPIVATATNLLAPYLHAKAAEQSRATDEINGETSSSHSAQQQPA